MAEAVLRLNEAAEKEAETAAALEEADRKLRALKSERESMKDLEGREAQHVQVCKLQMSAALQGRVCPCVLLRPIYSCCIACARMQAVLSSNPMNHASEVSYLLSSMPAATVDAVLPRARR